jgi:hypothetical protein
MKPYILIAALVAGFAASAQADEPPAQQNLRLSWSNNMLTIAAERLPGGAVKVWYLEAFCRPGSTDRDWHETVIPHKTRIVEQDPAGQWLKLESVLDDGVRVTHEIRSSADEVDFQLTASNPTDRPSQAHWAQPCVRVDTFTGVKPEKNSEAYLPKCFVFVDGALTRLPTRPWATQARYTPGQVWCPKGVDRNDVNPRPLSAIVPSNGLIGCFSADESQVLAMAWEPYQELFQGVIVCIHSDFRIAGLAAGQSKRIRGKMYLTDSNIAKLLERYHRDFPEQVSGLENRHSRATSAPAATIRSEPTAPAGP